MLLSALDCLDCMTAGTVLTGLAATTAVVLQMIIGHEKIATAWSKFRTRLILRQRVKGSKLRFEDFYEEDPRGQAGFIATYHNTGCPRLLYQYIANYVKWALPRPITARRERRRIMKRDDAVSKMNAGFVIRCAGESDGTNYFYLEGEPEIRLDYFRYIPDFHPLWENSLVLSGVLEHFYDGDGGKVERCWRKR